MGWPDKQQWLDGAEIVDAWRVWPRIFVSVLLYQLIDLHQWYMTKADNPDFYAPLVFGVVGAITGWYMSSGRKWA